MDNSNTNLPEQQFEPGPDDQLEPLGETQAAPEAEGGSYVNERIQHAYKRVKNGYAQVKDKYNQSPRVQKIAYQGKFLPAFWTVASICSLIVNIILIAALISFGRHFFELKSLVSDGLVNGLSNNLALMDKAHIVTTVPVETKVPVENKKGSDKLRVTDESIKESKDLQDEILEADKKTKGKLSRNPYSLHVGIFKNKANATALAEKYKKRGYNAFLQKDTSKEKGATFYRVLIGRFNSKQETERYARAFRTKEKVNVIVYRD